MSKLLDFINQLDKDANLRTTYKADKAKTMSDFGLTAAEQHAVRSKDPKMIADLAGIPETALLSPLNIPNGTY